MPEPSLPSGIPTVAAYRACLETPLFREMESFSADFLRRNRARLLYYSLRWSQDPLHHPTRQWEYPFTYERLLACAPRRILDAGSGVTFFPYFFMAKNPSASVTCCDQDAYVGELYRRLDATQQHSVNFERCDLRSLPFEDDRFDALCCTSVLEHTGDYETIAREFRRVVAPGGRVVLTFDVSLDGAVDIPVEEAHRLLELLASTFRVVDAPPLSLDAEDAYDTVRCAALAPQGAFWSAYRGSVRLANALRGRGAAVPPRMTFYCGEYAVA